MTILPNLLALNQGRALQKKQTGWVHFCKESEDPDVHDTIPIYENALFALALFRSRLSDQVVEGRALMERILAFEVEGNFPVYLHEYPLCHDPFLGLRLLPVFFWLTVDFPHVMGGLADAVKALTERVLAAVQGRELPEWARLRMRAMRGESFALPDNLDEGLVSLQIAEKRGVCIESAIEEASRLWHPKLSLYIGPQLQRHYRGYGPEVTLFDLFMSQWQDRFSDRVLAPAPVHLKGALIRPLAAAHASRISHQDVKKDEPYVHFDPTEEIPFWVAWGTHTFALARKRLNKVEAVSGALLLHIPEGEEMGVNFYLDHHRDHLFFVDGKKGSIFRAGQQLEIRSNGVRLALSFQVEDGVYMGHLMRGDRPFQHAHGGGYDWRIAIRTIVPGCRPMLVQLKILGSQPLLPLRASHCQHRG